MPLSIQRFNSQQRNWDYCLRLLGQKAYSEEELRRKLHHKKAKKVEAEAIIERLKELNLINDESYARMFVESRLRLKPKGRFALTQELRRKGISQDIIQRALDDLATDDYSLAHIVIKKFEKRLEKLPLKKRKQKYIRLLASRGFNTEVIYNILQKIS